MTLPSALEYQKFQFRFLFPIHFLLCFPVSHCPLFPVSVCPAYPFTCIFSITLFNQYHYLKLEWEYLYGGKMISCAKISLIQWPLDSRCETKEERRLWFFRRKHESRVPEWLKQGKWWTHEFARVSLSLFVWFCFTLNERFGIKQFSVYFCFSLFDSSEERYRKLRISVSRLSLLQIGISTMWSCVFIYLDMYMSVSVHT